MQNSANTMPSICSANAEAPKRWWLCSTKKTISAMKRSSGCIHSFLLIPPPFKVDLNSAKCSLARLKLAIKYEQKTVLLFHCIDWLAFIAVCGTPPLPAAAHFNLVRFWMNWRNIRWIFVQVRGLPIEAAPFLACSHADHLHVAGIWLALAGHLLHPTAQIAHWRNCLKMRIICTN